MALSNWTSGTAGKMEGSRHAGTGTDTAPASGLAGWFIVIFVTLRLTGNITHTTAL